MPQDPLTSIQVDAPEAHSLRLSCNWCPHTVRWIGKTPLSQLLRDALQHATSEHKEA
jgi:hypothetical protein